MSWKSEKIAHDALFDGTETKLLVSASKPRFHERFLKSKVIGLESIIEKFEKNSKFY